jgi:hypothetical protein
MLDTLQLKTTALTAFWQWLPQVGTTEALKKAGAEVGRSDRTVRAWLDEYYIEGQFSESQQGAHAKTEWLLEGHPELQAEAKQYIRANAIRRGKPNLRPLDF